jgi:hypothetical protein
VRSREPFGLRLERHATRDLDSLSIDPAIIVGKERGDHRSDVIRHSGSAQGGHFRDKFINFRVVAYHAAAKICLDSARGNDIGSNAA